ncbi:hypothetical protein IIE18_27985, partial [Pseudomonas sp. V1]|uniref:hypothetical protein n=1 Tax=Pseudomonas arcuscaelestis TaxID=2710591 RepID=UPI00193FCF05
MTQFHYQPDQLPPCANTLADGKRIDFTYEPALDQQLLCIQPVGEPANSFTYDQRLALTASASGPLGTQQMSYTASGKPASDTWSVDGRDHSTTWRHSLGGLLLGFVDANDADHVYHYDTLGRLENVVVGKVTTHIGHDEFSRPEVLTTTDSASGNQLVQTLTYDSLGREHTRSYASRIGGETQTSVQTLTYTDLDQLATRQWQDDQRQGMETFAYDVRGRLVTYTAEPSVAPEDPFG